MTIFEGTIYNYRSYGSGINSKVEICYLILSEKMVDVGKP